MALQSHHLRVQTLSVLGDAPPNGLQPKLGDGIHLRWAFPPQRGFPWHGYYLFRRPSREPERHCMLGDLRNRPPGPVGSIQFPTSVATVTSDVPLVLTGDFPPAGFAEFDLRNREWLRAALPSGTLAWRAYVKLGFRGGVERHCTHLERLRPGARPNPAVIEDVELTARGREGRPMPEGRITGTEPAGWDVAHATTARLPCAASEVTVTLLTEAAPVRADAHAGDGTVVGTATVTGTGRQVLTLTGKAITHITITAPQGETRLAAICWVCAHDDGVTVTSLAGGSPLDAVTVYGAPGEVRTVEVGADVIEAVEISGGADASVIDICFALVGRGVGGGWQTAPGFPQPLSLPVDHPDYPCATKPATPVQARAQALGRIVYGAPAPWGGANFDDLRDRLVRLVDEGPAGPSMHERFEEMAADPAPPPEAGGDVLHKKQRPLELVLLGSLHPAIAQMAGLYWLDKSAVAGQHYDYLLVADHDGSLGGNAAKALSWLDSPDFAVVDGHLAFDRVLQPAPPLPPPAGLKAYALPGGTYEASDGTLVDGTNNTGLHWDRKLIGNVLAHGAPVLYHVWRSDLGDGEDPPAPPPGDFEPITADMPIPVALPIGGPPPATPAQWPPFSVHHLDRALAEGWYAYRVNGVDLFGRHSQSSAPAQWWQWAPRPDPAPWYYQHPPADTLLDAGRIRLLDKLPPPPPTGVEAFALDPLDPTVARDSAWEAWWDSLSAAERTSVIGLRVRWRWTAAQQRQAPDTREFRIHYQAAPVNSLRGRVTAVAAAGAAQSTVTTDIVNAHPAGTFDGLHLRAGNLSFRIAQSHAGSPLTVVVHNVGPADETPPPARVRCSLALPPGHPLHTDFGPSTAWADRVLTVGYGEHVAVTGTERRYEVFLPVADAPDRAGLPLGTTPQEPMAYGLVGVTAADDKQHSPDPRGDAARFGNESRVGGPATVFRVHRTPPPPPAVPPDSERVFASPADYHGRSFYTFRWLPSAHLRTHVFRALDDAVFRADRSRRPRPPLAADDPAFPTEFGPARRTAVTAELDALNGAAPAAYRELSNDGLRVLAALPGVEKAFIQVTSEALDPGEPDANAPGGLRWRRVGPDVPPGSLAAGQRAYVDTLDGRSRSRWFYRCGYVDEVHNIGPLGVSGPPVWLPPVVAPRAPVIASIRGGARVITLAWASNREPGLVEYRVMRAGDAAAARDIRLMTHVGTVAVPPGDPADRPATVSWDDDPVPGLVTFRYRVVAVDEDGNVSAASQPMAARAHDVAPPVVPGLGAGWVEILGVVRAELSWTSDHEVLIQRRPFTGGTWVDLAQWRPPGAHTLRDPYSEPETGHQYRTRVRKYTGAVAQGAAVILDPAP